VKILHHALIQKDTLAAESVALHTPSQSISFTIAKEELPLSLLPHSTEVSLNGSATHDFAEQHPVAEVTTIPSVTQQSKGEIESPIQQKAGLRVLLVEDNEINLKLLIACMRKLKLDHATATNGLEALNSYKESEGRFDVVFMGIFPISLFPDLVIPPYFLLRQTTYEVYV
jgi:PleD family two-component response regulator